jgi:PAS domain S-box-containing protein
MTPSIPFAHESSMANSNLLGPEEALQTGEAELRAMFELSGVGQVQADPATGRFLRVNERQCQITGYSREELLGMTFPQITHPEDRERDLAYFRRLARGETKRESIEKRYIRKDGSVVWVQVTATMVRDGTGRPVRSVAVVQDISERRQIEEALRATREQLQQVTDTMSVPVTHCSRDLRYLWVSKSYARWLGLAPEQIAGRPIVEVIGADGLAAIEPHIRRVLAGQTVEYEDEVSFQGLGRRWIHAVYSPTQGPGGVPDGWVAVVHDITEQRLAAEALRQSEERYRDLFENANDVIYTLDLQGRITSLNRRAEQVLGYSREECLGRNVAELIVPDYLPRMQEARRQKLKGEASPTVYEIETLCKDGRRVPLEVSSRLILQDGQPVGIQGIARDISERKRAEQDLLEASRRKDEFLAMLAHELRNPLAPIRTSVQVLKLLGPAGTNASQARDLIERQVAHLARLVDDLLDVSRITRGKVLLRKERLDLVALTRSVIEDLRALLTTTGLELAADLPAGPLWVDGDPIRLSQVIGNLLHNANKFTDPGGRVEVRLETEAAGPARLTVRDTGIGMEARMLARLFEPFSQADESLDRSRGGLGLGLTLVKGLVELHGGSVQAASPGPGRGSEFVIRLPIADCGLRIADFCNPQSTIRNPQSLRVLIVEDNRDAAESLRMLLELTGHEVAVAHTGQAGLETARGFRPDVVLCDIGLPGGMDGYAVVRALRADPELYGVTAIALSGYGQEEDQRKARQAGFDHHLTKPASPEEIERLLRIKGV